MGKKKGLENGEQPDGYGGEYGGGTDGEGRGRAVGGCRGRHARSRGCSTKANGKLKGMAAMTRFMSTTSSGSASKAMYLRCTSIGTPHPAARSSISTCSYSLPSTLSVGSSR